MKIEAGKYYVSNDGEIYGPARLHEDNNDHCWIVPDNRGHQWGYTDDGVFLGNTASYCRSLKAISDRDHDGNLVQTQSSAEKPIHEMVLDDYRRGVDAIWDQRHNIGV